MFKIPILMYHEVSKDVEKNKRVRSMHPSYSLSVGKFAQQLQYLFKNNFHSISLEQLLHLEDGNLKNKKYVALTFDDGHIGNFVYALPNLKRYSFVATFFVTVDWIGNSNMLDWEQLLEMSENGMSIQSHGMTHDPLATLPEKRIRYELLRSKEIIEDKLGKKVRFLSVPHGSIDSRCKEIAREVGYQGMCTSKVGYLAHHDYFEMERILIAERYDIEKFRGIMELNHLTMIELKISKQLRNLVKKVIGVDSYRKIYRRLYNIRLL